MHEVEKKKEILLIREEVKEKYENACNIQPELKTVEDVINKDFWISE